LKFNSQINGLGGVFEKSRGGLEKEFPNRVYSDLTGVIRQLEAGLPRLAANTKRLHIDFQINSFQIG